VRVSGEAFVTDRDESSDLASTDLSGLQVPDRSRSPDRVTGDLPAPVDPLQAEWEARVSKALKVIDKGLDMEKELGNPDEYRARLAAADRVLGFRRGGLPMPSGRALGVGEVEVKDGDKVIRLRWADGRPVVLPLHDPMKRGASPDGDDD
jgi:hypothetical protein